jgi:hypothetical protein
VPFDSITDMLKVAPDLMRLQSWRSVYGMAARCVKDERLRMVLTFQTLLVGGSPFTTTLANGDRLVAQANGDGSVQVWKTTGANWTYLGQTPASTFTAGGRVGMQLPAGARVDNFEGVTLP